MSFVPEGFEPADDMNHVRPDDTPNWTESYAFWAYWEGCYLYMHFQRHPEDSGMWRGYITVNGEDGSVVASHAFGREHSVLGPGYQQCHALCESPFESYRIKVDTIGQKSDWESLRAGPLPGLDDNIVPLKLDLELTSISATYAPMRSQTTTHSNASWTHFTPCRAVGTITIGNEQSFIDGAGYRDHSAGVRSFDAMRSGYMLTGVFPSGRSFMAIGVGTQQEHGDTSFMGVGGVTVDGKLAYGSKIDVPEQTLSLPMPRSDLGTIRFESEHGESTIEARTTNQGVVFALLPPCFESIGLPQGLKSRLFYHEWRLDLEWDGENGVGGWEPCLLNFQPG